MKDRSMKGIVCTHFNESSLEPLPNPSPGPDEVLLRIDRVQLSVTECNLYRGNEIAHYEVVRDRLERGDGRLFGHEFCGTVVDVGERVTSFVEDDRAYAPGKIPCGECRQCATGFELHCPDKTYIGYDIPGALSEYVALPAEPLCVVPDDVSDAEAAALQPLASTALCVEEAGIVPGDVVVVIGTGVMGYQCAQLALIRGAGRVFAVDIDPEKLAAAESQGIEPIDANETDPAAVIRERTNGIGADVAFEAVGGNQTNATAGSDPLAQAFEVVRSGGTVVQVGYIIGDVSLTPRRIRSKSIDWINPVTGATAMTPNSSTGEHVAKLVADGRVSIDEYVTHELNGLERFETAVEITMNKEAYGANGPAQLVL
jgi:threonine dehydrogenase-like Zn-dependent dehydrogenase